MFACILALDLCPRLRYVVRFAQTPSLFVDDFGKTAAGERSDRCATGQTFRSDQPEWFVPTGRQNRHGRVLHDRCKTLMVGMPEIADVIAKQRSDLGVEVLDIVLWPHQY